MTSTAIAIDYPEDLPVSQRRHDIAQAIKDHQVVIVSGETGSGKTTQLPKICLELGRGQAGMIGHTQPRRLAATSVARRVAQELNTQLGQLVGYQIRFGHKSTQHTAIKLMTDGILLAESQRDPLLRKYDTIIIDEAHERSLNIDFLLGFLSQLLPKRPDLKLIITSATIDAQRFAEHFSRPGKPAPIIEVSGRLYPVEIRYRPILTGSAAREAEGEGAQEDVDDDEGDITAALVSAVQECEQHGHGDILVFLPGEREIREAAEALTSSVRGHTEVLPLFARLSRADQEKIFSPTSNVRRIVLATNVAETSLTVPGIRYVIDSGLARVKRYSWRNKVEQLLVERISQASANQRAGRCGRIGPGICIRLYDEEDFARRDEFTDPEILRSSLASVILRMKVLGLDDVDKFPFVDAPHPRAVADGYHLLQELGALDDDRALTKVGRALARLPLDPRLARMLLAARDHECLHEILIITSALSVQDPRERPAERREAATQAHALFRHKQSEFMAYVKLWEWAESQYKNRESQRKYREGLRKHFVSPGRIREWRDVFNQLQALVRQQRWRINGKEATLEQVHTALLTGLLGNIGWKTEVSDQYQGARDIQFFVHPGSDLRRRAGRWVVAGELVQTSRLFARCVANIDPRWIERAGRHLIRKSWSSPRWEKNRGQVIADEQGTVYGLPIYAKRRIHYGRINPREARERFIREALVAGDIRSRLPFIRHNSRLIRQIERLEHQSRRPDILVDDERIFAFYDALIPERVFQTASLERWYKTLKPAARDALKLSREELMQHDAAGVTADVFPKQVQWDGIDYRLSYHFEPGSVRDGVTLRLPLMALNQLDGQRSEWLVPGMLKEKVQLLVRSLPQRLRRACVPLPEYAQDFYERWYDHAQQPTMPLLDAIIEDMLRHKGVQVSSDDFKPDTLPAHCFMNFTVVDEKGRFLSGGRDLEALRRQHQEEAQASFQEAATGDGALALDLVQQGLTTWSFGALPAQVEIQRKGQTLLGFPALVDQGNHCDIDVFDGAEQAHAQHRQGLIRLFALNLKEQVRYIGKNIPEFTAMSLLFMRLGTQEDLRRQLIEKALDEVCLTDAWPQDAKTFQARCQSGKKKLTQFAWELSELVFTSVKAWNETLQALPQVKHHEASVADMQAHLEGLMHPTFIRDTPMAQLRHFPRYIKSVQVRIDRLLNNPSLDYRAMEELTPLLEKYQEARNMTRKTAPDAAWLAQLDAFGWQLQELRVSLFAQELRTPMPVSVKRLNRRWEAMQAAA